MSKSIIIMTHHDPQGSGKYCKHRKFITKLKLYKIHQG